MPLLFCKYVIIYVYLFCKDGKQAIVPVKVELSNPLSCLLCKVYTGQTPAILIKHTVRVSIACHFTSRLYSISLHVSQLPEEHEAEIDYEGSCSVLTREDNSHFYLQLQIEGLHKQYVAYVYTLLIFSNLIS